jgi:phosphatidate cytidylyltransferase
MVAVLAVRLPARRTVTLVLFGLMAWFALREFVTLTPTRTADRCRCRWPSSWSRCPAQFLLIGTRPVRHVRDLRARVRVPAAAVGRRAARRRAGLPATRTAKLQWGLMITSTA